MNTTRHMLLTAALAGSLTLAACSDEAQDPPSPSSSDPAEESSPAGEASPSGSPSSEPTDTRPSEDPSPSASPSDAGTSPSPSSPAPSSSSSAAPSPSDGGSPSPSDGASSPSEDAAGLPTMPPAAKENSEEGAEAFARWYVETLNHLYQHPQTGILDKYAGDDCKGCATQLRVMDRSVRNGEVAQGDVYTILGSSVLMTGDSRYEAVVAFRQHPVVFIDSQGKQVDKMKAQEEFGLRFELQYDDEWRVDAQFSNKSPQYEADSQ